MRGTPAGDSCPGFRVPQPVQPQPRVPQPVQSKPLAPQPVQLQPRILFQRGMKMNFEKAISERSSHLNEVIQAYLPKPEGYAARVIEAMDYSVEAGGKRLRPMFVLETCRMYGGEERDAAPFLAALEMIHTYSLVHDDLPEMDNDEYRRGKKTTHAVFGAGMAVIAGDGLLNFAYETVLRAIAEEEREAVQARKIRAACLMAKNAGVYGMVGGQCADLVGEGKNGVTAGELWYIHKHKTACMIESGLAIGAMLAGAPEDDIDRLQKIGEDIGIAFQIEDDILDVRGSAAELGKSTGKDAAENKATYISVHGLEQAERDAEKLTREALGLFDSLSAENEFLRTLIQSLMTRTH